MSEPAKKPLRPSDPTMPVQPEAKETSARQQPPDEEATLAAPASPEPRRAAQLPRELPAPFGRYRLLRLLGQGGMGAVYLAHDTQLDRPVALKVPHLETEGSHVLERFYREARAAATILHPNICPLHDVGELNGIPYLTMAYVEGKSLAAFAAARPLTSRQSALLVRKLALGLQEAHKRGVIHRDLKPSNVMIDKRGEPIIMDFGLARRARKGDARLTQQGSVLGTPAYMPPEQVSGKIDAMGPACDVYSLGVILYELLTGRLPFEGDVMAMLSQVLMDEPPAPSDLRPGLDPELEAICLKAMAKKPEDRHASMAELAADLTDHLRSKTGTADESPTPPQAQKEEADTEPEGIRVSRMGGLRSVAQLPAQPPAARGSDKARRSRRRKKAASGVPPWLWPVGAGGLVLLLVLGWIIFRPAKPGATQAKNEGKPNGVQEQGFRPLFNGRDLAGWTYHPDQPGSWEVRDGILTSRGPRSYLFSSRGDYENFHLRAEAQINAAGNSGVFFRSEYGFNALIGGKTGVYPRGYEAQIYLAGGGEANRTGSLLPNFVPVRERLVQPDTWFTLEVIAEGNHLLIRVDGKTTVDFVDQKNSYTRGYLALQHSDPGTAVKFRKIEIKELSATVPAKSAFVSLFNGKDLSGWTVESGDRDRWWAAAGDLVAAGTDRQEGMGWLLTQKDYADFVLRFEFLLSRGGNSGVTFRAAPGEKKHLEIQILDDARYPQMPEKVLTGSLWGLAIDRRAVLKPLWEWNHMEIELRGRELRITVNGQDTLRANLDRFAASAGQLLALARPSGRIGFQNWDHAVRFRNIQLQDLSAP